ncbi:MAG: hypothetical protein HY897_20335 [Deltaproteobacteria bacterium]|nr:hypothetical protein [Deltaproteobacteria bacterium]
MHEFLFCPVCGATLVQASVDGRERRKCPSDPGLFVHWDNPVPVVAAVIEHE